MLLMEKKMRDYEIIDPGQTWPLTTVGYYTENSTVETSLQIVR